MTGRPVETSRSTCSKCGEILRPGDRFCGFCGNSVVGCERCGAALGKLDRFCPRCGASVAATPAPTAASSSQPGTVEENPWALVVNRLRAATAGEFEILRELGRGGMAAVYLAHEVALNRKVAIKVMSPALLTGAGMVTRFRQEAITVANMSHPHIITIHAVRQIEDLHFFVMKFVEGRSLEHIIRSAGPLPIATVRGLLWMVGNALAYAHRRGVVHRDVKPANILVDEDGNAVVTDFGIAKLVLGDASVPRTSQGGQTQTGIIVGTPTYMSPEQCLARPVSAASDQYSLGLVAYELLTGRPPFTGSPFVVMHAHTERPAPPIRELRPDCDAQLDDAVQRMLAKEPSQRWASVQHALAALGAVPLGDTDPSRLELARLSIPSPFRRSDEVLQVTPSPRPITPGAPRIDEPRPYVAAVEIFAPPALVEVGDTFTLSASPRNPSGDTMPGVRVRWSSGDERIATIDESRGLVQALAPGEVEIHAVAGGIRNFVKVTVVPVRVAAINLSLPPGAMRVGDRVQLVAMPEDKRHEGVAATVHWASADESIAEVGVDGIVSAKAPGQVLVWAESQGVRGMARIEVSPAPVAALRLPDDNLLIEAGETLALVAIPVDASGNELPERAVRWRSSNDAIAEVITDRAVLARSAGVVRLTATSEGKSATLVLTVLVAEVAELRITPPPSHVDLGLPLTLHAEVTSTRGARVNRPVSWRSETPDTATVSSEGVVLPLAPGGATIVASLDGVEEAVPFEVNPAPELIVPSDALSATAVLEFSEVRRMLGQIDDEAEAATEADDAAPSVADVSAEAVEQSATPFQELAPDEDRDGERTDDEHAEVAFVAEERDSDWRDASEQPDESEEDVDNVTAQEEREAPTYVAAAAADSVDDVIGTSVVPPGDRRFLSRRLAMAGAGVVAIAALAAWALWPTGSGPRDQLLTTSSGTVATDSARLNAGDSTTTPPDTATVPAVANTTPTAIPSDSLVVAALRPLRVGDSTLLRGRIIGDTVGRSAPIEWTSSAPNVLRVNGRTGRVVAIGEGRATLTGRWGNAVATVPVRVLPAAVATQAGVTGQPARVADLIASDVKQALHEGDTVRVVAAALDENGRSILNRRPAWRSERPDVASVDEWGLVTARRVGKTEIVASLEQHAVRVPIVVAPRPVGANEVENALRAQIDQFLAALTGRDAERVTALYSVGSPQDQKNLDWLVDKVQRSEANLRVGRVQLRRPTISQSEAVTELSIRLTWTQPNGRDRDTNATFRARFARNGEGWEPAGIRATRNLD